MDLTKLEFKKLTEEEIRTCWNHAEEVRLFIKDRLGINIICNICCEHGNDYNNDGYYNYLDISVSVDNVNYKKVRCSISDTKEKTFEYLIMILIEDNNIDTWKFGRFAKIINDFLNDNYFTESGENNIIEDTLYAKLADGSKLDMCLSDIIKIEIIADIEDKYNTESMSKLIAYTDCEKWIFDVPKLEITSEDIL